jgi:hypothetical protein
MLELKSTLHHSYRSLSRDELITREVVVFLGVSEGAAQLLNELGIRTVFDLGVSHLFNTARQLSMIVNNTDGIARYQRIPGDALDASFDVGSLSALASASPEVLRNVGPVTAEKLRTQLGVSTLYELGHWQPFLIANFLVHETLVEESQFIDPGVPQELVPKFNQYPTEKFFYSVYAMDGPDTNDQLQPLDGPLDITALNDEGLLAVRTGAIIRYEQAWTSVGLALGNLLHSLALAPGESTRIAMIDWSRRQGVRTSEDISQTEALANSLMHTRAINEVTQAVAREAQSGFSQMNANSTVSNNAYSAYGVQNTEQALLAAGAGALTGAQAAGALGAVGGAGVGGLIGAAGAGVGAVPGAIGGALIGGGAGGLVGFAAGGAAGFLSAAEFGASSSSDSLTATEVVTTTSSSGERDLFASMQQNVADRTQQHASSSRNRKATIVQEVWQSESEEIRTRTVTNYNHMHALTIQYFEVVQMYSVATRVADVQRCLYIPLKSIPWAQENIMRYKSVLLASSLDSRLTNALLLSDGYVVISSPLYAHLPEEQRVRDMTDPRWRDVERLQNARVVLGDTVASLPFDPWLIPDDIVVDDVSVITWTSRVDDQGNLLDDAAAPPVGILRDANNVLGRPLRQLSRIEWSISKSELVAYQSINITQSVFLEFTLKLIHTNGSFSWRSKTRLSLDEFSAGDNTLVLAVFTSGGTSQWVTDHLEAYTKHYSRAVWRSLDEADIATLLSRYTLEGQRLIDHIDSKPVALSGHYLVFAYHYMTDEWQKWLRAHGYDSSAVPLIEMLPMPTGGVFAEAVQGRANSAERLDLTRFWNWQDSPIPLTAPEIAAIQSGSRVTEVDMRPGSLEAPMISVASPPAIPDPQGMSAILNALTTSNMFRDMSGLSEARQLASDALQQAQAGATAAGEQASRNLANGIQMTSQAIQKMLSMFGDLANTIAASGFAALGGKGSNVSTKNASTAGAILNKATELDGKEKANGAGDRPDPAVTSSPQSSSSSVPNNASSPPTGSFSTPANSLERRAVETLISGAGYTPNSLGSTDNGASMVTFPGNRNDARSAPGDTATGPYLGMDNPTPTAADNPDLAPLLAQASASDNGYDRALEGLIQLIEEAMLMGKDPLPIYEIAFQTLPTAWNHSVNRAVAAFNGGEINALTRLDKLLADAAMLPPLRGATTQADVLGRLDATLSFVDLQFPAFSEGGTPLTISGRLLQRLPGGQQDPLANATVRVHAPGTYEENFTIATGTDGRFSFTVTHGIPDPNSVVITRFTGFHDLSVFLSAHSIISPLIMANEMVAIPGKLVIRLLEAVYMDNGNDARSDPSNNIVLATSGLKIWLHFVITKGGQILTEHPLDAPPALYGGGNIDSYTTTTRQDGLISVIYDPLDNNTGVAYLSVQASTGDGQVAAARADLQFS